MVYFFMKGEINMEKKMLLNLFENQAHFGHYRKHRTPQLNSNIYTTKFGVDFINLDLSVKQIELAKDFISRTRGKNILIVSARSYLISKNSENNIYQISKWKPGYISNFDYGKLDELPNIVIVDKAAYQENLIKKT